VELEQNFEQLRKQGIGLAAVSYDSVAILKDFTGRRHITYPLLSDEGSKTIRAFGILNTSVKQGTFAFGVPYPVTLVTDAAGVVRTKYFEEDYRERPTLAAILDRAYGLSPTAARGEAKAKHVKITTSASTATIRGGQRILLAVDVDIPPGYHLYAPGVEGYYGVDWKFSESSGYKPHPVTFPAPRILYLKAIEEKVPVFEGKLHILRDLTIGQDAQVRPLANAGNQVTFEAAFRYQACSETLCYPPETVPLKWTFQLEAMDRERAPEAIRHK
jgi:hypothetical protein